MKTGQRQLLREAAFDIVDDAQAAARLASEFGLSLANRHDRKEVQQAIAIVKGSKERLQNGRPEEISS